MPKQAHLTISGRVQGVFYRDFTQENAKLLSLTGWVRNAADGTVEAVVQGDNSAIEELIKRLYKGPPSANVTNIQVEEEESDEIFRTFSIHY